MPHVSFYWLPGLSVGFLADRETESLLVMVLIVGLEITWPLGGWTWGAGWGH